MAGGETLADSPEVDSPYRLLFLSVPLPVLVFDCDSLSILEVNQAALDQYGYSRGEFLALNLTNLCPPGEVPSLPLDLSQTRDESRNVEMWSHRRKDGSPFRAEVVSSPLEIEGRRCRVAVVEVGRDVSLESELEARGRQAEKMEAVGQLAAGIAHDFNNLLQVILAYSGFLLKEAPSESLTEEDIRRIIEAGEKAADLTRQLLAFSRQSEMSMGPFDLRPLIKETVKLLERTFPSTIEIRCVLPSEEDFPLILGDPAGLNQVIVNLCINARDAMPEGGSLRIDLGVETPGPESTASAPGAAPDGAYVRISIQDSGLGIPAEELEHIFEPFFTTKPQGQGTGLGLSSALGIVQQHQGSIACQSRPGEGTTFVVHLPVHEESRRASSWDIESPPLPGGEETLLIVDDNSHVLNVLERTFRQAGYRVLTARDGQEAIERFEAANRVDLVLTDIQMPRVDGLNLARFVLDRSPSTQVVLQSGFVDENLLSEYRSMGVDGVIQKPIAPTELARRIRETLDREKSS